MKYQTRLIHMSYTNMSKASNNARTQEYKKDGLIEISLNFKVQYKVRRVREKSNAQYFYIASLKPTLHLVGQGNLGLTLHSFKRFTKFITLHFQNMQEHHIMTLES